jgi:hypothetical protein
VLPSYRGRGLTKICLRYIIEEIRIHLPRIVAIYFEVVKDSSMMLKLQRIGFQVDESTTTASDLSYCVTFKGDINALCQQHAI